MLFTIGLFYALLEEVYSTGMINGLVVWWQSKMLLQGTSGSICGLYTPL